MDKTVTKEGIRVEVGQVWQDLDRRMKHRTITITRVDSMNGRAYFDYPRIGSIAISRMHKHSTGFALVKP